MSVVDARCEAVDIIERFVGVWIGFGWATVRRGIVRGARRHIRPVSLLQVLGLLQIVARSCTLLCIWFFVRTVRVVHLALRLNCMCVWVFFRGIWEVRSR